MGSNSNIESFTFLEAAVNRAKGAIEIYKCPMSAKVLSVTLNNAVNGNETAAETLLAPLRETRGVFQYVRDNQVVRQLDTAVYEQLQIIETNDLEAAGLTF
jgi:hypothetical protein